MWRAAWVSRMEVDMAVEGRMGRIEVCMTVVEVDMAVEGRMQRIEMFLGH